MTSHPELHPDGDLHKGATEDDSPHMPGEQDTAHNYMSGQVGHRNAEDLLQENDSDFPEPGSNAEHSGQHK